MPNVGDDVIKSLTDAPKAAYHAVTHAFGLDDEGEDPKKKKAVPFPGPTMTDEANKTFSDDPSTKSPAAAASKPSFMTKAMAKKPAPAPPAASAARNRYGSLNKKIKY